MNEPDMKVREGVTPWRSHGKPFGGESIQGGDMIFKRSMDEGFEKSQIPFSRPDRFFLFL